MKLFLFSLLICCTTIAQQNEWLTKFEKSNYFETDRYKETMNYFQRLDDNSENAKMFSFGVSPQGRNLNCIVVSKDKAFTPADAKKTGKPVVMIINGIHSGEIEGKDACMLLLREILITKEKENLLDNITLLIVPIFSVDGHERFRQYNRINQNGPTEMGWRTTSQNLNLNRDWMKADAPEMQDMLKLFVNWLPDFFVDTHTTDGADYQYTVTYGIETGGNIYKEIAGMNKNKFIPYLEESVEKAGYLFTNYVNFKDWNKGFESGLTDGIPLPRFSTGYTAVQNRPGLLVETHMLKPYKERVFSTKVVLESVINFCSENGRELVAINKRADENSIKQYYSEREYLPLTYKLTDSTVTEKFKGKAFDKIQSEISGIQKVVYKDKDTVFDVTVYKNTYLADSAKAPDFYLIPQEWKEIVERIRLHGINVEQLNNEEEFTVTKYKFSNVKYDTVSFEGRTRINYDVESFKEKIKEPAGTFKVSTNQRTIRVILNLLEPKGEDSFVKWGFFNAIFEQKEFSDNYIMEKVAAQMLKDDPELKKEFEKKLADDEVFRKDSSARLNFFYMRSPYWDEKLRVYPVMRVE